MSVNIKDLEIGDLVIGARDGEKRTGVVIGQGSEKRMFWFSSGYCSIPDWDGTFKDYNPLDIYKKKDINILSVLDKELISWLT